MAAAAIALTFLQVLHSPSPIITSPSFFLSKLTPPRHLHSRDSTRSFRHSLHSLSTMTTHYSRSNSIRTASHTSSTVVGNILDYLNESWTPFHATAAAKQLLLIDAGFTN